MTDESKALRDSEMEEAVGGSEGTDWLKGWEAYDGSRGELLCPKCMSSDLMIYRILDTRRYMCCACKHEFRESQAGQRSSGHF